MNKAKVNELLPKAYDVLEKVNIANNGSVVKTYRSHISTFGAAIYGGSLLSAIAFFSTESNNADETKVSRPKVLKALDILVEEKAIDAEVKDRALFEYVRAELKKGVSEYELREIILDAAIALKLAMNLYTLVKED